MTIKATGLGILHHKSKKTLDDLLSSKEVITGKEVIYNIQEKKKRHKEFEESMEFEERQRRKTK